MPGIPDLSNYPRGKPGASPKGDIAVIYDSWRHDCVCQLELSNWCSWAARDSEAYASYTEVVHRIPLHYSYEFPLISDLPLNKGPIACMKQPGRWQPQNCPSQNALQKSWRATGEFALPDSPDEIRSAGWGLSGIEYEWNIIHSTTIRQWYYQIRGNHCILLSWLCNSSQGQAVLCTRPAQAAGVARNGAGC